MDVREIIETWLKEKGYGGLYHADTECGCEIGDLMPCNSFSGDCMAGHKVPCDCGEKCDRHISGDKE